MRNKVKKSHIILFTAIVYVFVIIFIEIFNAKYDKEELGKFNNELNYISCITVENNVHLNIIQGDSNFIEVTPDIEMFYSSGCIFIHGSGTANLNVFRNTVQEIYAKNNAIIKGEPGDSLKSVNVFNNSSVELTLRGDVVSSLKLNSFDRSRIKIRANEIKRLIVTADNFSSINIFAKVDSIKERKAKNGKIIIEQGNIKK